MIVLNYVVQCLNDAVSLQNDVTKKDEEDVVEPVPQISEFVIDDLRKYATYMSFVYSKTRI